MSDALQAPPGGRASAGARVMVVSLPKSGTHVVNSILQRMPPMRRQTRLFLNSKLRLHPFNFLPFFGTETCLAGIKRPQTVKLAALRHSLARIGPWRYATGHIPYQPAVKALMDELGLIVFVVVRDPRDVLVSGMHFALKTRHHFLHQTLAALPDDRARLLALIAGGRTRGGFDYMGMAQQLDLVYGWIRQPDVLTLRFEDVIGSRGGGSDERQRDAILAIARRIGIALDADAAGRIGRDMFGTGVTFRKGAIGGWREAFDAEIAARFREAVGDRMETMGYSWTEAALAAG